MASTGDSAGASSSPERPQAQAAPKRHPFKDSTSLLEILPPDIDVEEEVKTYEDMCDTPVTEVPSDEEFIGSSTNAAGSSRRKPSHRPRPDSVFSHDSLSIWLADNSGNGSSGTFARDVQIIGWTSVGDKKGGAYIVYDCAIHTKDGAVVHVHKRYSAFEQLSSRLRSTLPPHQQPLIPVLPPKNPLSKFRSAFLDKRRRALQHWLASILLHPDLGGCEAVRQWVINS